MNKIINIGVVDLGGLKGGQLFCNIELKEGRLSISGVEAVSYTHLTLPTNREV